MNDASFMKMIVWVTKTNAFIKNCPALELRLGTKEKYGEAIKPCCSLDLRQVESFQEQLHEPELPFLDLKILKFLLKTHHLQHPLHFYIKAVDVFINCKDWPWKIPEKRTHGQLPLSLSSTWWTHSVCTMEWKTWMLQALTYLTGMCYWSQKLMC